MGHRAIMKQHFVRGRRLSATGLLTIDDIGQVAGVWSWSQALGDAVGLD